MKPRRLIALLLIAIAVPASAGSPQLQNVLPVAGQQGQQVEVELVGARLNDISEVLFATPGITAAQPVYENNRVTTTFTIAPDAPLGEHQLRVVTRTGVTEMMTFQVVDRPIVREDEENPSTFESPLMVSPGSIALGRTRAEDVDYFGIELTQGQRLTVQVSGMSLGRGFTDSHITVVGPAGEPIAVCDDTALLRQDPYISFIAPSAGRYVVVIRDSGYQGSDNDWYLLHVGPFLRPSMVYPLGGQPGEQVSLRFIGDAAGNFTQRVTLPPSPDNGYVIMPMYDGQVAPSGHRFRVNNLVNYFEADSTTNNSMDAVAEAESYELPLAFNGIIEAAGDQDFFKLRLKKDQQVTLQCYASSMGSPLDSIVNVWRADNRQHLQGNDDQGGPDSTVTFTAPEDGEYFVRVRDHRMRGGPEFVYRIEATVPVSSLSTYIHTYNNNAPQERQAIAIPQGNRYAALVRVRRENAGDDLSPVIEGQPAGVTFDGYAPAGRDMMPVVFEANAEAPLDAVLVDLQAVGPPRGESEERIIGSFNQVTPLVIANPNRTEYAHTEQSRLPIVVTEAVPFRINVVQPRAPLVRDGKIRLQVQIERNEYEGRMRIYQLWRPPGMGATGQIQINNDQNEVIYEVEANNSTDLRTWPMVVVGTGDTSLGAVWVSSQLFELTVEEPFVTGTLTNTTCTRGEAVDVEVALQHPRQWQGTGELRLLGLPAECAAEPITITPGQESATFRVQTADNTPTGRHQSLMCELTIQVNGEPCIHLFGRGGQLRIDRSRPQRDNQEGGE